MGPKRVLQTLSTFCLVLIKQKFLFSNVCCLCFEICQVRLIFRNFFFPKSFYWQNKRLASLSTKNPFHYNTATLIPILIPHTCQMKNDSEIHGCANDAYDWSRNLLTMFVISLSVPRTEGSLTSVVGQRVKAIHNNDETDITYAPHRGSDVLMSFLTPVQFCM